MRAEEFITENLRDWFKEKWVRFNPQGKIMGACARGSDKEGKPKCLPQSKAHSLGKKGRASAAAKKRREDPNPERRGAAKNVATRVRENEIQDLEKVLQNPHSYDAIDHMMQSIAKKSNITAKELHDRFVAKHDKTPDDWIKNKTTTVKEETQDDRNARIIAGEIEDAAAQGNEQLVKQKIKQLISIGYTLDKDGELQRMGMYEAQTDYQKRRQRERDVDAGRPVKPLPKNPQTDYAKKRAKDQRDMELGEEQDACYRKVKSRYKVWPSAYASGALVQCRKKGAANWGNKGKK